MFSQMPGMILIFCCCRTQHLFKPRPGEEPKDNKFYRKLYPQIIQDIDVSFSVNPVDMITFTIPYHIPYHESHVTLSHLGIKSLISYQKFNVTLKLNSVYLSLWSQKGKTKETR